jgi:NAD(P)-dependent dehydrogenase (short-subunit alcohol dehydrogenase family)
MASNTEDRLIVILGSGPGIGVGVASYFAGQSFNKVALLSRNATRLQSDAESVRKAAKEARGVDVLVKTYPVDLEQNELVEKVLEQLVKDLGPPEVVVYNAARVGSSDLKSLQVPDKTVSLDFNVGLLSSANAD